MITDFIRLWARQDPGRTALIHDGERTSYGALAAGIARARRVVEESGPPAGATAVVAVDNLRHAWFLLLGLREAGFNTIAASQAQPASSLGLSGTAFLATCDTAEIATPPADWRVVRVPESTFATLSAREVPPDRPRDRPIGAHILHTSGSTGERKKLLTPGTIEDAVNQARAEAFRLTPDSVHHGFNFGLWTGIGYRQAAAAWHAGARVVIDQRPDSLRHFFDHGVTRASMMPGVVAELLRSAGPGHEPHGALELRVGGGPLTLELARLAVDRLTPDLKITYMATELCVTPLLSRFLATDDLTWLSPTGLRSLEIVDRDGLPCADGVEGELRIRTTSLDAREYFDDPALTARHFRDGYFYPGDLAVRRGDGRMRLLGRAQDVLIIGGDKVPAAQLELDLQRQLRVSEVCMFTLPLDPGGQELVIAIETDRELAPYERLALAREFDLFERVRISLHPKFPRTPTGKVLRKDVRDLVAAAARTAHA